MSDQRETRQVRSLRQRLRRGQSMVEYSVVSHAILLIGGTSMLGVAQYLRLFESLDTYLRSVYTVLRMGGI